VLGLGAEWLARSGQSVAAGAVDLIVGWTLIACGLISWSRRPQSRVGPLIALSGFTWFLGSLAGSDVGAIATLGVVLLTLHRGPLFHSIIGYPSGRTSDRVDAFAVLVGYAYAATAPLARNNVVTVVVVSLVLVTTIRGYALAAGPERRARLTAMIAAVAVALPLAGGSVERLMGAGPNVERAVLWGYEAALILIAVGFLVDLLRRPEPAPMRSARCGCASAIWTAPRRRSEPRIRSVTNLTRASRSCISREVGPKLLGHRSRRRWPTRSIRCIAPGCWPPGLRSHLPVTTSRMPGRRPASWGRSHRDIRLADVARDGAPDERRYADVRRRADARDRRATEGRPGVDRDGRAVRIREDASVARARASVLRGRGVRRHGAAGRQGVFRTPRRCTGGEPVRRTEQRLGRR
jgi:hypothetical protein